MELSHLAWNNQSSFPLKHRIFMYLDKIRVLLEKKKEDYLKEDGD